MARRRQRRSRESNLNFDALVDILTCSVGIMIITVVLALMDARSAAINVTLPMAQEPPSHATRKIFLCQEGRVRPLDLDRAFDYLIDGRKPSFASLPAMVKRANSLAISDKYFHYRFALREWTTFRSRARGVEMIVEERADAPGFDLSQLKENPSGFEALLKELTESAIWIAFLVDEHSIPVFREARVLANKMGIRTGWDPGRIKMPYHEMVLGGRRGSSKEAPSGPLRKIQ